LAGTHEISPLTYPPLEWQIVVVTLTITPSKDGDWMTLSPFADMTGRIVFRTSAKSAYRLLKCGFRLPFVAFSTSPCILASEAKSSGVLCSRFILFFFLFILSGFYFLAASIS
jgi:hypothetical protein